MTVHRAIYTWSQVDNPVVPCGLAGQSAIEIGPKIRINLGVEAATDILLAPGPELHGREVRTTSAQALA